MNDEPLQETKQGEISKYNNEIRVASQKLGGLIEQLENLLSAVMRSEGERRPQVDTGANAPVKSGKTKLGIELQSHADIIRTQQTRIDGIIDRLEL